MRRSYFITALIIAASISTLVVVFQNRSSSLKCSLDGVRIDPLYEVTIIQEGETSYSFSCILSAQIWLMEKSEPLSSIWVTDEMTGEKIKAELAYYVESDTITTPHTGNRIHVFAQEKAAKLHAQKYKGKFAKNPLRVWPQRRVKLAEYTPYSPDGTDLILPSSQKPLCLASNTLLISRANYRCILQRWLSQLCRGYASPPDKPPKNFS
jgi:hypothetical protein